MSGRLWNSLQAPMGFDRRGHGPAVGGPNAPIACVSAFALNPDIVVLIEYLGSPGIGSVGHALVRVVPLILYGALTWLSTVLAGAGAE